MATGTRKRKQRNPVVPDETMQPPHSTTTRTQVGRRVSNDELQDQRNPNQVLSNLPRQGQTSYGLNGLEANQLIGCHETSSHVDESIEQNAPELYSTASEVQQVNDHDPENDDKKPRGPTYMLQIWGRPSNLPLIQLDFDSLGRPVGPNQSKFSEFLGTIARNGMYCPLDVEAWHKMPNENKRKMLDIVKSRFDISLGDEVWILTSINKKWRSWKSFLKTRFFIPDKPVDCLVDERDGRVLQDQWIKILEYWNKEEVKVRSEKNKVARSKRSMDHLTGKTPFAQVQDKLAKEKGRPPSRAEMLDSCFTSKENTPSLVSTYLEQIKELRNQLPEGSEDPVGPNDLYAQVCGPDRPGRVRMFGEGVSPSVVWGEVPNRNMYKRLMLEQRSEMSKLKNEIAELQSKLLGHTQSSQVITPVPNNLPRPTLSTQHLQVGGYVILKSMFDQGTIVAQGCLYSTDPNAEVGGQELGENWCQVQVKAAFQAKEKLIRPYDHCQTIGDAIGEMVAWPCYLVTPIG